MGKPAQANTVLIFNYQATGGRPAQTGSRCADTAASILGRVLPGAGRCHSARGPIAPSTAPGASTVSKDCLAEPSQSAARAAPQHHCALPAPREAELSPPASSSPPSALCHPPLHAQCLPQFTLSSPGQWTDMTPGRFPPRQASSPPNRRWHLANLQAHSCHRQPGEAPLDGQAWIPCASHPAHCCTDALGTAARCLPGRGRITHEVGGDQRAHSGLCEELASPRPQQQTRQAHHTAPCAQPAVNFTLTGLGFQGERQDCPLLVPRGCTPAKSRRDQMLRSSPQGPTQGLPVPAPPSLGTPWTGPHPQCQALLRKKWDVPQPRGSCLEAELSPPHVPPSHAAPRAQCPAPGISSEQLPVLSSGQWQPLNAHGVSLHG